MYPKTIMHTRVQRFGKKKKKSVHSIGCTWNVRQRQKMRVGNVGEGHITRDLIYHIKIKNSDFI